MIDKLVGDNYKLELEQRYIFEMDDKDISLYDYESIDYDLLVILKRKHKKYGVS